MPRIMKQDQIVIYKDENNSIQLDVRMEGEMLWLDRQQLATLFGRDYKTISKHINNALKDLYPSVEEKAAMLLYLVTKNHSFSDGNKRIAATLFLWFLNNGRERRDGEGSGEPRGRARLGQRNCLAIGW